MFKCKNLDENIECFQSGNEFSTAILIFSPSLQKTYQFNFDFWSIFRSAFDKILCLYPRRRRRHHLRIWLCLHAAQHFKIQVGKQNFVKSCCSTFQNTSKQNFVKSCMLLNILKYKSTKFCLLIHMSYQKAFQITKG